MRVAPLSWTTAAGWRPDTFVREEPNLILYSAAVRRWRRVHPSTRWP